MVTGDEEILFLYINNGDGTIRCSTNITRTVDGEEKVKKTKSVTIRSYESAFGDEEVNIIPDQPKQDVNEATSSTAEKETTNSNESNQTENNTVPGENQETGDAGQNDPANDNSAVLDQNVNGGQDEIVYSMNRNVEQMLQVTTEIGSKTQRQTHTLSEMGEGMRSIYLLSLLETYTEMQEQLSSILMIEEPELFLHPTLQRVAGEILYRLSRKNQVVFTTHSPNLLANFNSREIRQVVLDKQGRSIVRDNTDISVILDDLGYTATDLMNVNFVFIVEGKQDKNRLPILLKRYYSEIYDKDGNLSRIAIITTNSCTNIKTYANLKYMNQVYLKDQFLMIRDGDGKDRRKLISQLCNYYEEAGKRDVDHLPKVRPQNVLVLKYYSFENYFFNPKIMAQLGVVESENAFYQTFYEKWQEYLSRLSSGQKLISVIGHDLTGPEDVKAHMEEIRIYMRGHNMFDCFYGRFKKEENELLSRYVALAPREEFADILDAIDRFVYFESRKV